MGGAMAVDLHLHSTASDGTTSPSDLVAMAARSGLSAMALTDHDTQEGWEEASAAARDTGIDLIPGVELSIDFARGMHLLVLWLRPGRGPLQDRLEDLRASRDIRNTRITELLRNHGMEITDEEVAAEAGGGTVGRPHIAAVLMAKGYVPDIASAFEQWIGRGRPAYVTRNRLGAEEAITLARESGGVPVLAHPHTLGVNRAEEMARILSELRSYGLVGIEAVYASYQRHERDGYSNLARRFKLVPSGGSDYHGEYKPGLQPGIGYGDLVVPYRILEELREYAVEK